MPTDSYFYLVRQIEKCMTSNLRGSVRTQKKNTQNIPNSDVFFYGRERIKNDQREQEKIKNHSCKCLFYGGEQIRKHSLNES